MENLCSSFSRGHVRHSGEDAVCETHVIVNINVLARATGGLGQLYKKIDDGTAAQLNKNDYGKFTNNSGHFVPEKGFILFGRYAIHSQIQACGQSAVLVKAQDSFSSLEPVVIKVMHTNFFHVGQKEINTLTRLSRADPKHTAHTIKLLNTFVFDGHICMVFPVLDPRPVTRVLAEKCLGKKQKLSFIRKIALRLLSAMAFLRGENTIHADIKPANILLDTDGDVDSLTLVDFGNAIYHTYDEMSLYYTDFEVQTPSYRAPEVHTGLPFSVEVDMWSVGVVLLELFTGQAVFAGPDRVHMLRKIVSLLGPLPEDMLLRGKFSNEAQMATEYCVNKSNSRVTRLMQAIPNLRDYDFASFLLSLLTFNPDQRATPWQALQHPFMSPEICISHFLYEPSTHLSVVRKADYVFKPNITLNKQDACSITSDPLNSKSKTGSCDSVEHIIQNKEARNETNAKGKIKTCFKTGDCVEDSSIDDSVNGCKIPQSDERHDRKRSQSDERQSAEFKRKRCTPPNNDSLKLAAHEVLLQHVSNTSRQGLETREQNFIKFESKSVKGNDQKETFMKRPIFGEENVLIERKWEKRGTIPQHSASQVKMQEDTDNLLDLSTATYTVIKKAQTQDTSLNSLLNTSIVRNLTPTVKGCEIIQSDEHKRRKTDSLKSENERKKKPWRIIKRFRSPKVSGDHDLCSERNASENSHSASCKRKRTLDHQRLTIRDIHREEDTPLISSSKRTKQPETDSKEVSNISFSNELLLRNLENESRSKQGEETRYGKMVSHRVSKSGSSENVPVSDLRDRKCLDEDGNVKISESDSANVHLSDQSLIRDTFEGKCCYQVNKFDNACVNETESVGGYIQRIRRSRRIQRMSNIIDGRLDESVTHEEGIEIEKGENILDGSLNEEVEDKGILNFTFTLDLPAVDLSEEEDACTRSEVNNAQRCIERSLEKAPMNLNNSEKENFCNQRLGTETIHDNNDKPSYREQVKMSQAVLSVSCQGLNKDSSADKGTSEEAMEKIKERCDKNENSSQKLQDLRSRKQSQSQIAMETKTRSKRRQRNGIDKVNTSRKGVNQCTDKLNASRKGVNECERRISNNHCETETKTIFVKNKDRVNSRTKERDTAVTNIVQKRSSQRTCSLGVEYTENRMNYIREMYTDMFSAVIKPMKMFNRKDKIQLTTGQKMKHLPCKPRRRKSQSRNRTVFKGQKRKLGQIDSKHIKKRHFESKQEDVEKRPVELKLAPEKDTQVDRDGKCGTSLKNEKELTSESGDVEQMGKYPQENREARRHTSRKSVKRALSFLACETQENSLGEKMENVLEGTLHSQTDVGCLGPKESKADQKQNTRLLIFDAILNDEISSDPYRFIVTPAKKVEKKKQVLRKKGKNGRRINCEKKKLSKDSRKIQDLVEETSQRLCMSPPQAEESCFMATCDKMYDVEHDSVLENGQLKKKNSTRLLQRVYHSSPCRNEVSSRPHNARSLKRLQHALDLNMNNTNADLNAKFPHAHFSKKLNTLDTNLQRNNTEMTNCNSCTSNELSSPVQTLSFSAAKTFQALRADIGEGSTKVPCSLNVRNENQNMSSSIAGKKESLVSIDSRKNEIPIERCTIDSSCCNNTICLKSELQMETKNLECGVTPICTFEEDISLLL